MHAQSYINYCSIVGVKVCCEATMVSHLLFADDSLILMEANEENVRTLKQVLDLYCSRFGQIVSATKCSIFFNTNTIVDEKVKMCEKLDIWTDSLNDRCIGLPSMVGEYIF
jgi:hypothetical protein